MENEMVNIRIILDKANNKSYELTHKIFIDK